MTKKEFLYYVKLYTGCTDYAIKRIEVLCKTYFEKNKLVQRQVVYQDRIIIKESNIFGEVKEELQPISEFLDSFCKAHSIEVKDLQSKARHKYLVRLRRDFTIAAYTAGYTFTSIAQVIKRDHTTAVYYYYHYKI
jgi:chromosomal replication initiation ATPase DnaA